MAVPCPLLPTEDRLILADVDAPPSSAVLTVIEHKPSYRGRVIAVGPEVQDVAVGDIVQYRPFVGARIEVDGVSWMLVREEECVCRLM